MSTILPRFTASFDLPWKAILASIATFLVLCLLAIQEVFKPIHLQKRRNGKQWHLPPGPIGSPIIGSLPQWRKARRDPVGFARHVEFFHATYFS